MTTIDAPNPPASSSRSAFSYGATLFALSFASLFLELMLIRWVPAVVRLVAYYANLMLISSFLGLGIGALLASRDKRLFRLFPLLLALDVLQLLAFVQVQLPTTKFESRFFAAPVPVFNYFVLISIFVFNTIVFVPLGERIGKLFRSLPSLQAYSWDLGGSLLGTISFGAFSILHFSPTIGVLIVMGIYLVVADRRTRWWGVLFLPLAACCVQFSTEPGAQWSPYHYITIAEIGNDSKTVRAAPSDLRTMNDPPMYTVRVGRDFYQRHGTIDVDRYTFAGRREWVRTLRDQYMLPYQLAAKRDRVAIMGAGGGMDVQAAILAGAKHVDAVEIDPTIVNISHQFNAADVYADPRVAVHIDDARAYLQKSTREFDVIAFGYLDSQSLFSTMSNVRIDGFIYTVESFRRAWNCLNDDGILAVSFFAPGEWMAPKLAQTIREATGVEPIIYADAGTVVICAAKGAHQPLPESAGGLKHVVASYPPMELPTDNWPFLYLRQRTIPPDYLLVIGTLAIFSVVAVTVIRGRQIGSGDSHFFFLGFAFLLLQTKSITDCSLYFGTTWLVTTIVIAGILMMVLTANIIAMRLRTSSTLLYLPLLISLLLLYFIPREVILAQSFAFRLVWSLLIVPLPILFAGLIFSTTFREARDPSLAFGANLIGATIGGFCEYLGMALGTHALALIVMGAYLASLLSRAKKAHGQAMGV